MCDFNFRRKTIRHRVLAAIVAAVPLALAPQGGAAAYTQNPLHAFCTEANCGDGDTPHAGLLRDASGNLYGTTEKGGKYDSGLVFKLIPNKKKTKYTEHVLKSFCAKANCADGGFPEAGLIMDVDGNIYGTTGAGGKYGAGAVFKMTPLANGWTYGVIHSFCHDPGCADGSDPTAELAYAGQSSGASWDETSPLFGTTYVGGANNRGAVYELSHTGSGWSFTLIHSYDTAFHGGELLVDMSGDLFGTTLLGGANSAGTLYKLASGSWNETTLHDFCAETNCADGTQPIGRLLMDSNGNLFGTASEGGSGAHCQQTAGCGVAYERTAGGKFKVLHDFCSLKNCNDGLYPSAGLIMGAGGDLLGTTYEGGTGPGGTAFSLDHGNKWAETVIYDFCSAQNCTDGAGVVTPLIMDASGDLFGTTALGGANATGGTVFELTP